MSEEKVFDPKNIPIEDRVLVVEQQGYMTSLILNSLVKILLEKGLFEEEELAKEMDELNERLYELSAEMMKNGTPDAPAAEGVTE